MGSAPPARAQCMSAESVDHDWLDGQMAGTLDGSVTEPMDGSLAADGGRMYSIRNGIPRFVPPDDQAQTQESFGYKWQKQDAYESEGYLRFIERDEVVRWGLGSIADFYDFF